MIRHKLSNKTKSATDRTQTFSPTKQPPKGRDFNGVRGERSYACAPAARSAQRRCRRQSRRRRPPAGPLPAPPLPAVPSTVRYATVRRTTKESLYAASLSALFFAVAPPVPYLGICGLPSGPVWVVGPCLDANFFSKFYYAKKKIPRHIKMPAHV
jgi:hypothetical protein